MAETPLFDQINWRDPLTGRELKPVVQARTPAGVPVCGALVVPGTNIGYPIVDCVVRLTPKLAHRYADWLRTLGLEPPVSRVGQAFQEESTVESFGFQWSLNSAMRSEADLEWRIAQLFGLQRTDFGGRLVLDAGAGAGDQSRWLLDRGAAVISLELSDAIDVVARKLRGNSRWVGVQGDITVLPFADQGFDLVYCEGVIHHTRNSQLAVNELCRVLRDHGIILATHYGVFPSTLKRLRLRFLTAVRNRVRRWDQWKLLWLTGNLAALAYVPLFGRLFILSGLAVYYDLMPDFKTTWTNTYDRFGIHAYQRHVTPDEFRLYFTRIAGMTIAYQDYMVVRAQKSQ